MTQQRVHVNSIKQPAIGLELSLSPHRHPYSLSNSAYRQILPQLPQSPVYRSRCNTSRHELPGRALVADFTQRLPQK